MLTKLWSARDQECPCACLPGRLGQARGGFNQGSRASTLTIPASPLGGGGAVGFLPSTLQVHLSLLLGLQGAHHCELGKECQACSAAISPADFHLPRWQRPNLPYGELRLFHERDCPGPWVGVPQGVPEFIGWEAALQDRCSRLEPNSCCLEGWLKSMRNRSAGWEHLPISALYLHKSVTEGEGLVCVYYSASRVCKCSNICKTRMYKTLSPMNSFMDNIPPKQGLDFTCTI